MSRLWLALLAGALVTGLVLTACGGSGSDTAPSITKAELIKKADRICGKADDTQFEESVAYEQEHKATLGSLPSQKRVQKLQVIVGLPSILKEGEELEALGAPDGEEKKLQAIYAALKSAVARSEREPAKMEDPDGPFAEVNRLTEAYGFKACSQVA